MPSHASWAPDGPFPLPLFQEAPSTSCELCSTSVFFLLQGALQMCFSRGHPTVNHHFNIISAALTQGAPKVRAHCGLIIREGPGWYWVIPSMTTVFSKTPTSEEFTLHLDNTPRPPHSKGGTWAVATAGGAVPAAQKRDQRGSCWRCL